MKPVIPLTAVACLLASGLASAAGKSCKWSDPEKMKQHISTHVSFPATGKEVKASCKTEMPDEIPKAERACFESLIKDGAKFASADELKVAAGIQ